jgi:hypothetical protein
MIPDDKAGRIMWRLFERRKAAGWMAEDYLPSGRKADNCLPRQRRGIRFSAVSSPNGYQ